MFHNVKNVHSFFENKVSRKTTNSAIGCIGAQARSSLLSVESLHYDGVATHLPSHGKGDVRGQPKDIRMPRP